MNPGTLSRRNVLALGWLPLIPRRHISLAGARFRILHNGRSNRRYLRIHGNEETAREVLERHMRTHEGTAFIVESKTRLVKAAGLDLDPNRMFSREGAERNLRERNPGADEVRVAAALHDLDRGRNRLVRALTPPAGGLTVALHNNSQTYSVADEAPISDRSSLRDPRDPHAFYLCTDPRDFEVLRNSGYNVVLQQHGPKDDDGSLSRLAAARGFRYVNLEVAHGAARRQSEMLDWLEWNLP
jgi:hypothetical protein